MITTIAALTIIPHSASLSKFIQPIQFILGMFNAEVEVLKRCLTVRRTDSGLQHFQQRRDRIFSGTVHCQEPQMGTQ